VIGYDEAGLTHGGGHAQRIRVWGVTGGTSGGVYQRVPVTAGQSYAVSVWAYAEDGSSTCYLGVDPAGGTNVNSGVSWSSGTANVGWVQQSWAGAATGNYLTIYLKVESSDGNKRNGYFDEVSSGGGGQSMRLSVQRSGELLMLSWPECPAAHLERADSLVSPVSWATVTNPPTTDGGQKSVTHMPTSTEGYFRLVLE